MKFVIPFLIAFSACAADLPLVWNSSTDTNVNAYRIYGWTNTPDAQCVASNASGMFQVGYVTNASFQLLTAGDYTFAATAINTNTGAESLFSNFTHWHVPEAPTLLINVQSSTNLIDWTNVPNLFFRLKISQ